jgi:hypothetical protein
VRQSAQGGIGTVASDQLLSEQRSAATRYGKHWSYPLSRTWIISARRMLSAIFALTTGDDFISSRFKRTAAISEAAMSKTESGLFASLLLLALLTLRFARQLALGPGGPLNTSAVLDRYAAQQQEQVTTTVSCGGGSALSGSACSICASMARQLTVQPHFLHFTTQAVGSPSPLVTPTIIGECMAKVILSQ